MHADQIAAVERVREKAARKGVEVLPPWLGYASHSDEWYIEYPFVNYVIPPYAAALIITGSLAKWLAGPHGCDADTWTALWYADFQLDDVLKAASTRLDELPDKPAPAESQPASKEGGR